MLGVQPPRDEFVEVPEDLILIHDQEFKDKKIVARIELEVSPDKAVKKRVEGNILDAVALTAAH